MDKIISKIFRKKEIDSVEKFYIYHERKKIILFVPESHLNILIKKMSDFGAGIIGEYSMCSFRTSGIGTFKPGSKSTPYSGKKNILTNESEYKLEMECDSENLNKVIDAVINNHPYEEAVYEVHEFKKRRKDPVGIMITLRNFINTDVIMKRLNNNLNASDFYNVTEFKKIIITGFNNDKDVLQTAVFLGCRCILNNSKNKFKLHIL